MGNLFHNQCKCQGRNHSSHTMTHSGEASPTTHKLLMPAHRIPHLANLSAQPTERTYCPPSLLRRVIAAEETQHKAMRENESQLATDAHGLKPSLPPTQISLHDELRRISCGARCGVLGKGKADLPCPPIVGRVIAPKNRLAKDESVGSKRWPDLRTEHRRSA